MVTRNAGNDRINDAGIQAPWLDSFRFTGQAWASTLLSAAGCDLPVNTGRGGFEFDKS